MSSNSESSFKHYAKFKILVEAMFLVQNQLVSILESTDPHNHNSIREAANKLFAVLDIFLHGSQAIF